MFQIKLKLKKQLGKFQTTRNAKKVMSQVSSGSIIGPLIGMFLKALVLTFFGAIILFPFYYMIATSLMTIAETRDTLNLHLAPATPHWDNYKQALATGDGYWNALQITFIVTFLSIVFKIIITMLMGYAFAFKKWRFKKIIWAFFLSLLALPEVALLLGQYQVMVDLNWNTGKMIIIALVIPFVASVFSAFMFKNAFESIPVKTKEAAKIDGASEIKFFFKIAAPMVSPTTWTVVILTGFAAWNSYIWPALLLPGTGYKVINLWLFDTGKDPSGQDTRIMMNIRMAAALFAILPMFLVYFVFRSRIMRAISRQGSAIKG